MTKLFGFLMFIVAFSTACVGPNLGRDFQRIEINKLMIGSDSPETIKQKIGNPNKEYTHTRGRNLIKTLEYSYSSTSAEGATKEAYLPTRVQSFYFFQDKLVGHDFKSDFAIDSTNFDESKINDIKEGTTTLQEVIAILGNPSGEWAYPLTEKEDEIYKVYLYTWGTRDRKLYSKILLAVTNENGIVTEVKYRERRQR